MHVKYSTVDIAQKERFEFWIDAICDAYVHLGCTTDERAQFWGEITHGSVRSAQLSYVTSSMQHVVRRKRDISRSTEDYVLMSIQIAGSGYVRQAGREAALLPGDFAIYSSTTPYELYFPAEFRQLVVQVPRQAVLASFPIADLLTAVPVNRSNEAARLTVRTLTDIASALQDRPEAGAGHLDAAVSELMCYGIAQITDGGLEAGDRYQHLTLLRMESFIASRLSDPALSREDVARHLGMSVRRLNELLARRGTSIAQCIRRRRLNRVMQDLSTPAMRHQPIGDLAAKWGFADAQHFSKLFRKSVGCSPSEYRSERIPEIAMTMPMPPCFEPEMKQ